MKAISTGNIFRIYDDTLKTYNQLPALPYVVRFSNTSGFYLERYSEIEITESKIYGVHTEKVQKVLNAFAEYNRSLGVILSGDKGIGKSLFAKLLAAKAMEMGMPLIIVDRYIGGIASYLESIEQEVMVLFDEFDKTYGEVNTPDGEMSPQASMLSLFDGVSPGKKLFVITCNELRKLNEYLINRPGRFHYHFRFNYPSADEVRQYLTDKLPADRYGEIDDVIAFSRKVNLNYDCLRAIAFEIANGLKFKDAISDLNIINLQCEQYTVILQYENEEALTARNVYLDLFGDEEECLDLYDRKGAYIATVMFNTADCVLDTKTYANIVFPDEFTLDYDSDERNEAAQKLKNEKVDRLVIRRPAMRNIHYAV